MVFPSGDIEVSNCLVQMLKFFFLKKFSNGSCSIGNIQSCKGAIALGNFYCIFPAILLYHCETSWMRYCGG